MNMYSKILDEKAHQQQETEQLSAGLPQLSRLEIDYQGVRISELDLINVNNASNWLTFTMMYLTFFVISSQWLTK